MFESCRAHFRVPAHFWPAGAEGGFGPWELTKNEIELVRFVREGRFGWDAHLADRS